jgi:hypothetical protein
MELQSLKNTLILTENADASLKKERSISYTGHSTEFSILDDLIEEAGKEVYNYLEKFEITQNTNIILLSSVRHYLYGPEELKQVKTVVNLKLMNQIKLIKYCLSAMNRVLPVGGTFVGCFFDSGKKGNKKIALNSSINKSELLFVNSEDQNDSSGFPIITWIYKMLYRRKFNSLPKNKARSILEKNGFLVSDMTEINGITYFISKKISNLKPESNSLFKPFNKC